MRKLVIRPRWAYDTKLNIEETNSHLQLVSNVVEGKNTSTPEADMKVSRLHDCVKKTKNNDLTMPFSRQPFHAATVLAQAALAATSQLMGDAVVRPASNTILDGKPAPKDGIALIGQQVRGSKAAQCNKREREDRNKSIHSVTDQTSSHSSAI